MIVKNKVFEWAGFVICLLAIIWDGYYRSIEGEANSRLIPFLALGVLTMLIGVMLRVFMKNKNDL